MAATPPVTPRDRKLRLDAALRAQLGGLPWLKVRRLIETGKVRVNGVTVTDAGATVVPGQQLEVVENAPRPSTEQRLGSGSIVFVDEHIVIVRKPSGISTVPFEEGERGTLHELVRAWLNRTARSRSDRATGDLGIVHRLDKETSGLLVFTRTLAAKRHLAQQFRVHSIERSYLAIAHGSVRRRQTFESRLVRDRGDGLRGSTDRDREGQEAVTHVEPLEQLRGATLVRCTLETGRTHQIRIHLGEAGHPLVGEHVYIRDFHGRLLPAPRLMLHAAVLGFDHPGHGGPVRFEEPMPDDMREVLASLRGEEAP
ncbi:MAG TPA: RluA family pseudouridine synthase [Polyangiaceae bacterium]|mgnify:FL=1|nr:RluA family pseudouridine synthase [Polyangiaceae bacterium]